MKANTSVLILLSSLVVASSFTTTTDVSFPRSSERPSFISKQLYQQKQPCRATRRSSRLSNSSRDEEIAKLEEQLRQLRVDAPDDVVAPAAESTKSEKEIVAVQRILEKVKGKDMLLSERELVDQELFLNEGGESEGGGGVVPAVLAALGAAVFLFFFSQIPVGQDDWSRYSTTSGPTTSTRIDLGDMNQDSK
jgi:biopolymer transport protein ExbD